jgi:tetratricopeptide (TPR) repeat protein
LLHAILLLQLTVTPQEAHHAEDLVHASMRDFDLFEYDQALREAVEAYRIDPLPQILFNIGQCHRALNHWDKAELFFQRYLHKVPDAPNRQLVEKLLAEVQQRLKTSEARPSPVEPAPQPIIVVSSQPPPQASAQVEIHTESVPPAAAAPVATVQVAQSRSSAPWWLIGTGAVVAAVGTGLTVYEVVAKVPQPTLSQAQTANTVGYVGQGAIGAGLVALVAGGLWALLQPAAQPEVAP